MVVMSVLLLSQIHVLLVKLIGLKLLTILVSNVQDYARHVQELQIIVILAIKGLRPTLRLKEGRLA